MTEIAATAAGYFGEMAASYDSLIRRAVPRYVEMTECLASYLPMSPRRALELGCGTGNLSLLLAERMPETAITFVDAAPEMVELTRSRLARTVPQSLRHAEFVVSRFEDLQPLGAYDLVVSCISLHHVVDKGALYRNLRQALRPGGTFRFADQVLGGSDANQQYNWARWLDFCRQPGHCTAEEIESLLEHAARHDHYVSLAEHFKMLDDAGFVNLDCVWRDLGWGIVTADVP